jgi:hypothetical protein
MLSDEQIAVLCDIGQSVAFSDDRQGLVQQLVIDGYVVKNGDLYELSAQGQAAVEDHPGQAQEIGQ